MDAKRAAETAQAALLWLAGREEAFGRFLAEAGMGPAEIRPRAGDPEFLGFVLDFLLADETLVLGFAEAEGLAPETPMRARAALPGGDAPHWT